MRETFVGGVVAVLSSAILVSALVSVYVKHQSRKQFIYLQELTAERDQLNVDWGRLQIEQSTWATHARVERLAREELEMIIPAHQDLVMVRP